jgi:hypothetical protein
MKFLKQSGCEKKTRDHYRSQIAPPMKKANTEMVKR